MDESGGLALRMARRPSGELVELYDQDWRTLPLFESPAHQLWPGELVAAAAGSSCGVRVDQPTRQTAL